MANTSIDMKTDIIFWYMYFTVHLYFRMLELKPTFSSAVDYIFVHLTCKHILMKKTYIFPQSAALFDAFLASLIYFNKTAYIFNKVLLYMSPYLHSNIKLGLWLHETT